MFSYRTIPAGERAALWARDGSVEFVGGPRRLWLRSGQRVQDSSRSRVSPESDDEAARCLSTRTATGFFVSGHVTTRVPLYFLYVRIAM